MKRGLRVAVMAMVAAAAGAVIWCSSLSGGPASAEASTVSHPAKYSSYVIEEGIDVSIWNGVINWFQVKESGVDFAFIRAGGVYYNSGVYYVDENFDRNLDGAILAGIDAGVYFFSQAISEKEAVKEAEYVLQLIDGRDLKLPVVFDFEYAGSGTEGRLYNAHLSARQQTDICLAFCRTIEEAGYEAMVYANAYMLWHRLYSHEIQQPYGVWLAEYHWNGGTASYLGEYNFWQYTQYGTTEGIGGYTDRNYRYIKPVVNVDSESAKHIKMDWTQVRSCDGYRIYRKDLGEFELMEILEGNERNSFTDTDIRTGKKYTYLIVPYNIDKNGVLNENYSIFGQVNAEVPKGFWWR